MPLFTALSQLIRSTKKRKATSERPTNSPELESLEDRCVPAVFTVNTLADIAPGDFDPGDSVVTLREAVERANDNDGLDIIRFSRTLRGTIELENGQLDVLDDVNIVGRGAARLAVSGNELSRVFGIGGDADVRISDLTIRDGVADEFGGGIFNEGDLTLVDVAVLNNTATSDEGDTTFGGGGIENRGSLTLWHSLIANNTLVGTQTVEEDIDNGGGGINNNGGQLNIFFSTISGNESFNAGGIRNSEGTMTMVGSVVANNTASGIVGGGLALVLSTNRISDSWIVNNEMNGGFGSGGAFSNDSSDTILNRTVVSGNTATGFGGAIVVAPVQEGGASSVVVNESLITHNVGTFGGAFAVVDGTSLIVNRSIVQHNQAFVDGGGIWAGSVIGLGEPNVIVNKSSISGNSAGGNGGGIYIQEAESLVLHEALIVGNTATDGGGLFIMTLPSTLAIDDAFIMFNSPNNVVIADA